MLKKNDGFTFIEIILTIVILGIISIAVIPGMIMGLKGIITEGNKEAAIYNAQSEIDRLIAVDSSNTDELIIIFSEGESDEKEVTMKGELLEVTSNYVTNNTESLSGKITITYFSPSI